MIYIPYKYFKPTHNDADQMTWQTAEGLALFCDLTEIDLETMVFTKTDRDEAHDEKSNFFIFRP